jgi:hypothetical protein
VIARVWHGRTKTEHVDSYESHLRPERLPALSKVPGFVSSYLLRQTMADEVEVITAIFCDSLGALRNFTGPEYETAIIPEDRRQCLKRFDAKDAHYEAGGKR